MLFNSFSFLFVFLPLVLAGWWGLRDRRARLILLTVASYVFYGWWDYRFVPLMLLSTSADYLAGSFIAGTRSKAVKKAWLVGLLVFNLGILAFFKYWDFAIETINGLARWGGVSIHLPLWHITLPIGISFYTFNSISYTIDIYRGRLKPAKSILEFSAFVAMFPHLISGPIIRYADMTAQFAELPQAPPPDSRTRGLWFFVCGMVKKVLIADTIAHAFVTPLYGAVDSLHFASAWIAALAYGLQLYFDFSGYSDMAVGLASFLGIQFPKNFDSPFKSANIAEFWQRWHISFSTWLRDYLFVPLGVAFGPLVALIVTMFLGGLWHGAAWTFVVYGLYHGVLLASHAGLKSKGWVPRSRALSVALTVLAVLWGLVIFRASSLGEALRIYAAMVGGRGLGSTSEVLGVLLRDLPGSAVLVAAMGIVFLAPNLWEVQLSSRRRYALVLALALVLCIFQFGTRSPFLYFQF